MADYDIVIKGGTVIDGTRTPRYRGDVAVLDGKVAAIGKIAASAGRRVLDADGLVVAPGFVGDGGDLWTFRGGVWNHRARIPSAIRLIYEDRSGRIWVGASDLQEWRDGRLWSAWRCW